MKYFYIFILMMLLSSCCIIRIPNFYYSSTLDINLLDDNGWEITTPHPGKWELSINRAYMPEYFPREDINQDPQSYFNFMYASYQKNNNIVILINFTGAFFMEKIIYGDGSCVPDSYRTPQKPCSERATRSVIVSFIPTDITFDNTSVYFIKNNNKIYGQEVTYNRFDLNEGKPVPPAIYTINSEDFIIEKQADRVTKKRDPLGYASLPFIFNMTCRDFHDSIFVIDGIYHQGKRLPPLKIHMKYIDLDAVPEYRGAQARPPAEQ